MAQQTLLDETAAPLVPPRPSLTKLREAAADCKACPLWKTGTQTVFGEGSPKAEIKTIWRRQRAAPHKRPRFAAAEQDPSRAQ